MYLRTHRCTFACTYVCMHVKELSRELRVCVYISHLYTNHTHIILHNVYIICIKMWVCVRIREASCVKAHLQVYQTVKPCSRTWWACPCLCERRVNSLSSSSLNHVSTCRSCSSFLIASTKTWWSVCKVSIRWVKALASCFSFVSTFSTSSTLISCCCNAIFAWQAEAYKALATVSLRLPFLWAICLWCPQFADIAHVAMAKASGVNLVYWCTVLNSAKWGDMPCLPLPCRCPNASTGNHIL